MLLSSTSVFKQVPINPTPSVSNRRGHSMPPARNGIVNVMSHGSVDETVDRTTAILHTNGATLFAVVDHSGEAAKAGLVMRPTKLVIFGNPESGTPLMQARPSIALDLPLKLLIWEDGDGKVWISYNDPEALANRHGLPPEFTPVLHAVEHIAALARR